MWKRKKSKLDNRLRELEAEEEAIRNSIRQLTRAMESGDPVPKTDAPVPSGSSMPSPSLRLGSSDSGFLPDASPGGLSVSGGGGGGSNSVLRADTRAGDARLGRYLQTTGFSSERPRRQERSVQRNKAIFMLVVVLVVLYVVLNKIFY